MISLNKYEISAKIKDRYAYILYSFSFENNNKHSTSNELKFEITIDPQAFISSFEADIDGEIFHGITKEKKTASKEYQAAKKKNENAILISKPYDNISNVFEIKTNIDAGSKILLNITIEQYLQKQFNFNQANIQILHDFRKYYIKKNYTYIPFTWEVSDQSGIYELDINTNQSIIDVNKNMDEMNQNCIINGKIMSTPSQSSLNELILKYKIKGEQNDSYVLYDSKTNTFCHIISDIIIDSVMDDDKNDATEGDSEVIQKNDILVPRRVMFVIDKSGSMGGIKWNKTISATVMALLKLRVGYDRFCIILFSNIVEIYPKQGFILAENKCISDTVSYLQSQNAGGGTNINDSLLKAIRLIKTDINKECDFFMNQIIFLTDGTPNKGERNTKKILLNVENENQLKDVNKYNNCKISICSFGVGTDANNSDWIKDLNHSFLKLLSLNNNGFYKRIKQTSADIVLNDYFNILSQPIALNINIKYDNKNIEQLTNNAFNVLYSGNDLIICGKVNAKSSNIDLNLSITAVTGQQEESDESITVKPIHIIKERQINIEDSKNENIERIWAYLKLKQLADQKLIIHNDMIELDDDEKKDNDSFPMSLAMKYKFVTPWTSMIVVKKKDNQHVQQDEKKQISNDDSKQSPLSSPLSSGQRVWGYTFNRNDAIAFKPYAQQQQQQHTVQSANVSNLYSSNECKSDTSSSANNAERDFYGSYWIEAGKIGEGAFSKVRIITRKSDGKKFDLKMIKKKGKSEADIKSAKMEIDVLKKCNHENIIEFESSVDTKKRIYVVVEMCNGGDIIERIVNFKHWSEQRTANLIKQIVSGLDHLHDLGFVHKDLKPENLVYLSNDENCLIKITGFEFVGNCNENNGFCEDICHGVTVNYSSPEIILSSKHNQLSDMWSIGAIIYILLCGFPPFFDKTNNIKNLYQQIVNCKYSFPSPFWDNISKHAKDLINTLLVKDVKNRLNAKQVLQHEWLKNVAIDNKNGNEFGIEYVKQISHWHTNVRHFTEVQMQNDAVAHMPNQPFNLYYDEK